MRQFDNVTIRAYFALTHERLKKRSRGQPAGIFVGASA